MSVQRHPFRRFTSETSPPPRTTHRIEDWVDDSAFSNALDIIVFKLLAPELFFLNFSTPCIWNMNKTGTKYVRIMKQTTFWREKYEEYITCLKYSVPISVE